MEPEFRLPSRRVRIVVSVLVVLHLLAVLGEPLRMFTQGSRQPAAPDAALVRGGLGPYIDFMYLHHGYFFFAPNPGPSHLMSITLIDADGSRRHLRLPDHQAQWPRLLYHRHFMLAEFLNQLYSPPVPPSPDGKTTPEREDWLRDRARFESVRNSMEKHLAARYGATRAEIQLMEHRLPSAVEVFDSRIPLNDPQLYIPLPDLPATADASGATATPPPARPSGTPLLPKQTSEEIKP